MYQSDFISLSDPTTDFWLILTDFGGEDITFLVRDPETVKPIVNSHTVIRCVSLLQYLLSLTTTDIITVLMTDGHIEYYSAATVLSGLLSLITH
jgi:hypothetical protein